MNFKEAINMHVEAISFQKKKSDFYSNVSHFICFEYLILKWKSISLKSDTTENVTRGFWKP